MNQGRLLNDFLELLAVIPGSALIADASGFIVDSNTQLENLFGYTHEQLQGKHLGLLMPEYFYSQYIKKSEPFINFLHLQIKGESKYIDGLHKTGKEIPVDLNMSFHKTNEGDFVIATLTDVTAYKLSAQQLKKEKQFNDQLRNELAHINRLATMGELTASIAHELNQPLTAIMSNAQAAQQFLTKPSPDLGEINEALVDIVSDDRRAGDIIKRLRVMLVKGESEHQSLHLAELVEEVVKLIMNDAKSKHVDIDFETASAVLPLIIGDKVQLQQVVLNLILNAFEAMENVDNVKRKLVIKLVQSSDDQLRVDFTDNGTGLLKQEPEQLFKAFNTSKNNGMGMGLTISRTIVEAHGGKLGALQNKKVGATFYFSLPPNAEVSA